MTPAELTTALKRRSQLLGFELARTCAAVEPRGYSRLKSWLESGFAGEMAWMGERLPAYAHPQHVLEGTRSLLVLAANYATSPGVSGNAHPLPGQGRVSCYAWGKDYHNTLRARLHRLADQLRIWCPHARVRGVIDTAPLLEREFAELAGIGWVGKNTMILNRALGSWFFLAVLLTDVELVYDAPESDHCGTCRACLDACPTQAFPEPYVLDARRCISYLTIEHRSAIPQELRAGLGEWVFGCDICQEVCPWNHRAPLSLEPSFAPREERPFLDLLALFSIDETAFRRRFAETPLWRARRRGLLRNAAVVLGNRPVPGAVEVLAKALEDVEPLVRGAAAWALGNYPANEVLGLLTARLEREDDPTIRQELQSAADACRDTSPDPPQGCQPI